MSLGFCLERHLTTSTWTSHGTRSVVYMLSEVWTQELLFFLKEKLKRTRSCKHINMLFLWHLPFNRGRHLQFASCGINITFNELLEQNADHSVANLYWHLHKKVPTVQHITVSWCNKATTHLKSIKYYFLGTSVYFVAPSSLVSSEIKQKQKQKPLSKNCN